MRAPGEARAPVERIEVGARQIAVDVRGPRAGPTVLLLHGGGFDRRVWEHAARALAARWCAVSLDLPGHGQSSGRAIRSVAEGSQLVEALRAELGIERWVVVGHSMGGAIAQDLARRVPERVAALGLISTAPWFGLDPAVVEQWRGQVAYSRERLDAIVGPGAGEALRAHVLALRDRLTPDGVDGDLDTCAGWDVRGQDAKLDLPVLLLSTPHDLPVIREATDAWGRSLPDAERISIDDAGHMMMVERPEETTAALVAWLERVLARERR